MKYLLTSSKYAIDSEYCGLKDEIVKRIMQHNKDNDSTKIAISSDTIQKYHGLASNNGFKCLFVVILTLDDLELLQRVAGDMLIIDFEGYDGQPEIEIYNDYRE